MQEMLQKNSPQEKSRPSPIAILGAVLILAALATVAWFVLQSRENRPSAQTNLPAKMSAEEAAYAKSVLIRNIALSRAENFIHQEVTILNADAVNGGSQAIQALTVTVEFSDDLGQVVLRESRGVLAAPSSPLAPGQSRNFQISFDRVPSSWNMQQPSVQVSYLRLAALK